MTDINIRNKKGRDRLLYELDKLKNDPDEDDCFRVDYWDPDNNNPDVFHWQITLIPPQGTDYEGGLFKIEAKFREDYPETAPILKFVTRIFHCNINSDGHICLNSINYTWRKSLSMEDVINHIMIFLYKQNPYDPFNCSAAELYRERDKNNKFIERVKKEIKDYANINDYENLQKQNISLIDNCQCDWCNTVFKSND